MMEKTKIFKETPFHEHFADDPFYLFLKKETFLFDAPHYHESIELIYMIEGKTTVHISGASHALEEGDIFICNTQQVHFYENYETPKLAFCVVLSDKYTHNFRERYNNALFPSLLQDKQKNKQIYELLQEWFTYEDKTFLVDCAYANLLLDKVLKLYDYTPAQSQDTMNTLAIEMINYITENYRENISLETAAKHFGYSKEYFSKVFKQTVGKNFLSFLNTTRTQKALEMMQKPGRKKSVNEICAACGFNNPTSLYRHLKRANSVTGAIDE